MKLFKIFIILQESLIEIYLNKLKIYWLIKTSKKKIINKKITNKNKMKIIIKKNKLMFKIISKNKNLLILLLKMKIKNQKKIL